MLSSWVPEACYFTDEGDYDVFTDLPWYSDPFLRQPLNETEMMNVRAGNYGHVYTTWAYHDEHCLYTWRKLAMAMEKRLPLIDTKTADEEHSQHCARVTRNYVREDGQEKIADLKTLGLKVTLTYFGCPGFSQGPKAFKSLKYWTFLDAVQSQIHLFQESPILYRYRPSLYSISYSTSLGKPTIRKLRHLVLMHISIVDL
ncbi:hypothetical protein EYC80_004383 [Monilinia laxa]|uniref:Uncharacterized protein n=1 Tax=Monilinia laxa TaxID=61186 RepID=A0A5N6KN29_MONLA|nr:hypothetical protein EYC80_004383 [Monilinia laxa]